MKRTPLVVASLITAGSLSAANARSDSADIVAREDLFSIGRSIINVDGRAAVALDRANALYRIGEEATFTVTISETNGVKATAGEVSWRLDNYGAHVFAEGRANLAAANPFVVRGTLPYPGFLRLVVRDAKGRQMRIYSAAYAPDQIRPAVPKPDDFDAFWDSSQARLAREVPLDVQLEAPEPGFEKRGVIVQRVSFATFGGRVYGVLSRPAKKGVYPARVYCPGAGPGFLLGGCCGTTSRVSLFMSVHSFPIPRTDAERTEKYEAQEARWRKIHGQNSARAYPVGGLTVSREAAHYYPVILGINRAVDWLATLPEVDAARITYSGASQGGGFGLYLAALNTHLAKAYIGVPALADLLSCKADGRQSGWPRITEYETQKDPARLATIQGNARYFDGAYFAERIRIPVRLSVGYADESCAPHAVLATYNAIPSADKKLYHGIGGHHGSPNAPAQEISAWIDAPATLTENRK